MRCNRCGKENPAEIHTCTPLAIWLADALESCSLHVGDPEQAQAAAELRRLHAVNEELLEALNALLNDVGRANSMLGAVKARAAIAKATGEQA